MTSPITTLVGTGKLRDDMDTLNENAVRRLAWSVETLTDATALTAEQGSTLFRLDSTTNSCDVTLPDDADLYVGWRARFVLVEASNGGDVAPDSGNLNGLDGGPVSHKALTDVWTQLEVVWTGDEWLVAHFFEPAP